MLRDIFVSLTGHTIVVGGLIASSFFGIKPSSIVIVQPITMVTPRQIERLLEQTTVKENTKPKVPQVQIKPDEKMPRKVRRRKQTVKKTEPKKQKPSPKKGKSLPGIQTDVEIDIDYLVAMRDKILRNWGYPRLQEALSTTVYFRISKSGNIEGIIKIEKPTGNIRFDRSAYEAIQKSNPFEPLPGELKKSGLGIHINFIYDPE